MILYYAPDNDILSLAYCTKTDSAYSLTEVKIPKNSNTFLGVCTLRIQGKDYGIAVEIDPNTFSSQTQPEILYYDGPASKKTDIYSLCVSEINAAINGNYSLLLKPNGYSFDELGFKNYP